MPLFQITAADESTLVYAVSPFDALKITKLEFRDDENEVTIKLLTDTGDEVDIYLEGLKEANCIRLGGLAATLSNLRDQLAISRELSRLQQMKISGLMSEWEQLKSERDSAREQRDAIQSKLDQLKLSALSQTYDLRDWLGSHLKRLKTKDQKKGKEVKSK